MPLVSVVVICYNYEKYLKEAVESVLSQTYKNTEIIIINDGSTDNSDKIAQRLIDQYPYIKYIQQENKGVVYTRNRAIEEVQGDYYIQLDADDFLDLNYIDETVKVAEETHADIVYTDFETFGIRQSRKSDFPDHNIEHLKNSNYIHIASLVRRASVGGNRFDPELDKRSHEDWDFFLTMSARGAQPVKCDSTLLHYRIHGNGRNNSVESAERRLDYLVTYSYIISKQLKDDKVNYEYLIGQTAAAWYKTLYGQYLALMQEREALAKEVTSLRIELDGIYSSTAFHVGNRLASPVRKVKKGIRNSSGKEEK